MSLAGMAIGSRAAGRQVPTTAVATVTAVPFDTFVNLSWSAVSGTTNDYAVQYRTTDGPGTWTTFSHAKYTDTIPNMSVTGLTSGVSYDFQVAAANDNGPGAFSQVATATTGSVVWGDTFHRANSNTTIGTSEVGAKAWTSHLGIHGITGNRAYCVSAAFTDQIATVDAGTANGTFYVRFDGHPVTNATGNPGIVFRYVDQNNFWAFVSDNTVFNMNGGVLTNVVTGTNPVVSGSPRDVSSVTLNGTSITVRRNSTVIYSATSTLHQTATRFGLRFRGDDVTNPRVSAVSHLTV